MDTINLRCETDQVFSAPDQRGSPACRKFDNSPQDEASLPLCVDLDGTLVRSDMLFEGILALATNRSLYRALFSLWTGNRASFKRDIAASAAIDPSLLPYNEAVLTYLREQRALGRRLVLVTAADSSIAEAIAAHLGLFEEVLASDGARNLKGLQKAQVLLERFGKNGFSYMGDSRADLCVWQFAGSGIVVNASGSTVAAARRLTHIEATFDRRPALHGLVQAMRPHQWVKNLLVFVPLFVSGAELTLTAFITAVLAFSAFCCTASGIYLLNDFADLNADRRHSRKRTRPFASGTLPLKVGMAAAPMLIAIGAVLGQLAHILPIIAVYCAVSVTYSMKLKESPLVDVFMLAALYSLRLVGGGEATDHRVSLWLLAFSSFLFLSLALVKRVGELEATSVNGGDQIGRRGYQPTDTIILQMFGCGCSVASSLVLALFIQSEATAEHYASPILLWALVPLALFWQCRIWLSTARGYMDDDPIVYAARDWVSWLVASVAVTVVIVARSLHVVG